MDQIIWSVLLAFVFTICGAAIATKADKQILINSGCAEYQLTDKSKNDPVLVSKECPAGTVVHF